METRSPQKTSSSRRNGDSTPKINVLKHSTEENETRSLPKRARPFDDDFVNPRLRSAKNFSNVIQDTSPVNRQLKDLQDFAQNVLIVPPILKKSISKSARTSREGSPTRSALKIPLLKELPRKLQRSESKSCPGSPQGRNRNLKKDMIDEEDEYTTESLRTFLYPNNRIKVFWTLPIKTIANNFQRKFEISSAVFPEKDDTLKKWSITLVITKNPDRLFVVDNMEILLCAVRNPKQEMSEDWKREQAVTVHCVQRKGELNYEKSFNKTFSALTPRFGVKIEKPRLDLTILGSELIVSCLIKEHRVSRSSDVKYVGLVNAGNTCYMNSFLQTLYHLSYLSRLVFKVPFAQDSQLSIPSALQKLFYNLTISNSAPRTTELTKSFGWDSKQTRIQQDVQEFCCLLLEALDAKTQGIPDVESKINKLFEGKMTSYIKCINVDFESTREETFKELQLHVKGLSNLYESIDSYVQDEILEGDNLYDTEMYGKQPARKGIRFEYFPRVLMIHLKRFEYDYNQDKNIKICDSYEYYPEIDLAKYLNKPSGRSTKYKLYSVLVHDGVGAASGHYYAFLRPQKDGVWYKFNDEYVDIALEESVYRANFGGTYTDAKLNKNKEIETWETVSNNTAYMLVYINEEGLEETLMPFSATDIPKTFIEEIGRQKKAADEQKRSNNDTTFSVYLTSFDLFEDITTPGLTYYKMGNYDEEHYEKYIKNKSKRHKMQVPKTHKVPELLQMITEHTGIPSDEYHLFKIAARDEKLTQITKRYTIKGTQYNLNILINGAYNASQKTKNLLLILPIDRKKHPRIFTENDEISEDKKNDLKFVYYAQTQSQKSREMVIPQSDCMVEESNSKSMFNRQASPIEQPKIVSKSQDMDIESNNTHSKLYESILQETYNLLFIKIFFNVSGKGQIKLLDYVFIRNTDSVAILIKFLESEHPDINWQGAIVYLEQKKKYDLELLPLTKTFIAFETGEILVIDVGKASATGAYVTAVQYYEECNNQVSVKFVGSKGGTFTKALLPKMMTLEDIFKFISHKIYHDTVDPDKILLKAKYKTSQTMTPVVANGGKDGKALNLGDLTKFDEKIIYEESQVAVSELDKLFKCVVSYYSIVTNQATLEEEIFIEKQATISMVLDKISKEKYFENEISADQMYLKQKHRSDALIVTVLDKAGKILLKCNDDVELKQIFKKGRLRLQFWNKNLKEDTLEAFCFHTTRDAYVIGNSFILAMSPKWNDRLLRTHLFNHMNDWEIDCQDKKHKFTLEYMQKLRVTLHYEKSGESPKFIKIEETFNEEDSITPLGLTKDHKIQIEVIHPFTLSIGNVAMKIL